MKMTLLEIVQSIMSDLDSDSVTSITDTDESLQVASIVRDVYFQLIANSEIPELKQLFAFADATSYVWFLIPATVQSIEWFKYDKQRDGDTDEEFQDMRFMDTKYFMDFVSMRKSSDTTNTLVTDPNSGLTFYAQNNKPPQYWTSFDDTYIACDSFDVDVDATGLLGSKTKGLATIIPTFTIDDDFTPDIDDNVFPLLLAEAKSTAFVNLKQTNNTKVEAQSRRQRILNQNDRFRTKSAEKAGINPAYNKTPNFGRRRGWS